MKKLKEIYQVGRIGSIIIIGLILSVSLCQGKTRNFDPLTIFTDHSCSVLKENISEKTISKMPESFYKDIALKLKSGNYPEGEYRIQSYRPYQIPKVSAARTKTLHTWGILDNITGMYIDDSEEEVFILVGDTHGQEVKLRVQDYSQPWGKNTITLKEGLNKVKPGSGLCYILILQDEYIPLNPETEKEKQEIESKSVKIHFVTGNVNGYYDIAKGKEQDSSFLISQAKYPYLDLKGKYSHLVWYTEDFKYAGTDLSQTIEQLDLLTGLEIDYAGFFKYGKPYSTRMLYMPSTNGKGNPNATLERVIFPRDYGMFFANPTQENLKKYFWGLAHEVGHCSQSNPGMRWGGMGEVGNNMFSLYVENQLFGYGNTRLLRGGDYERAQTFIIEKGLAHADPSIMNKHFERLVPFWQLHLYTTEIQNYPDLYRDLYEHYRKTPEVGTTFEKSGPLQLDFVRNICHLSKTNFLDFFRKWGFLTPIDVEVNDYGNRVLKITQEDIDALISEIERKNYKKPIHDVTTIRDDNFEEFK